MRSGDNLIKTFACCFRLLAKLNAGIKDGFFVDLISKESENLLSDYIKFLKMRGDTFAKNRNIATQFTVHEAQNHILQQEIVAKYPHIMQRSVYVAQCGTALTSQIQNVFELLEIIKYLRLTDQTTPLLLERELLKLKLLFLNDGKQFSAVGVRAGGSQKNQQKNKNLKNPVDNLSELNSDRNSDRKKLQELGTMHQRIAEFISGKEHVQNVEVFSQFADTTRRTLKRKLSELVKAGAIKRFALGKKVFYAVTKSQF